MNIKIYLFFWFINFLSGQVFCQQDSVFCNIKYYNINNIEYAIFPQFPQYLVNDTYPVYTKLVSIDKVLEVDSLAFEYVRKQKYLPNQGFDDCPIIKENWTDYYRQVICYLEKKSRKKYDEIIYIQYIYKDEADNYEKDFKDYMFLDRSWKKNWLNVNGGCSKYFHIFYNVRKKKIVNFVIN